MCLGGGGFRCSCREGWPSTRLQSACREYLLVSRMIKGKPREDTHEKGEWDGRKLVK